MLALTDLAVRNMIETRFKMPALWTTETVALMTRGDERFEKFPSLVEKRIESKKDIIFPFCAFIRSQGQLADDRFNFPMAFSGLRSNFDYRDRTRTSKVKMVPIQYPYIVRYYCDDYQHTTWIEKKYWGLKLDYQLPIKFPLDMCPDKTFDYEAQIIQLDGFEVANTDLTYERGRYYTGGMGFTVLTFVAEQVDVPLIQKIEVDVYNKDPEHYLDAFVIDKKFWR